MCGSGRIDVVGMQPDGSYAAMDSIRTAPRARTGLFVPEESTLYVAAPADGAAPARLLAYRVR